MLALREGLAAVLAKGIRVSLLCTATSFGAFYNNWRTFGADAAI